MSLASVLLVGQSKQLWQKKKVLSFLIYDSNPLHAVFKSKYLNVKIKTSNIQSDKEEAAFIFISVPVFVFS